MLTGVLVAGLAGLLALTGCSSSNTEVLRGQGATSAGGAPGGGGSGASGMSGGTSGAVSAGGQATDAGTGTGGAMGDGSLIINPGTTVTGVLPGAECASSTVRGQLFPLDMYVMMDRSVSMGSGTQYLLPDGSVRWDTVIKGFQTFVALPEAAGIGMGIQFFGAPKVNVNCDPTYYARPWVEIGLLPDNGPAILGAFSSVSPGGGTPMNAALEGAIAHARDWKLRTPDRNVIVVLVTDGWPNGCGLDAASVGVPAAADAMSQIAAAGLAGTPSVQTFVLGIADPADMDMAYIFAQIAAAGGTATPVIVATDNNLATEFSTALNQI
ncbi:MAG TPA: vWA domain-containing protein, partial [Polyangiaceae bacterium]